MIRVERPAFYVIGKEGKWLAEGALLGTSARELATKDFEEIEFLVSDQKAEELEFWGLMSDGTNC